LCTDSDSEETRAKNTCYVQMGSGLLYDFEELIDYSMTTDKLEAHFTHPTFYGWDLWIQMVVSTTSANNYASDAIAAAPDDTDAGEGSTVASETYGMAVDLWVRTNAEGTSYLLLDGALVTDDSGNVTGYEGSNRIWEEYDDETVFGTSTTQGSGSCYTFSYDSAEELTQILNMLENMKVVFFHTTNGTKLATASFDVTNYYESSGGRVTVPLRADSGDGNSITTTDENGDAVTTYYITQLVQNEAMPITALLYLDGTEITNADASVSENFTGELNIQFASSANLETSGSTSGDLYNDAVDLSAAAEYTTDNDGAVTAAVTLTVSSGTTPTAVSAGYSRQMNTGSQALRADAVDFTLSESSEGESTWTMEYTFSAAGTYVLGIVTVDGKEYELEEPLTVTVEGFALDAVRWDYSSSAYSDLTADSSVTVPVTLDFAVDYTGNQSVRAAYVSSDGKYIYASLTVDDDDASVWKGQAQFTSSGTYTLKYFYIGNDIYDIPEAMQKTLTVSMGLRASVRLTCTSFEEGQTSIVYEDGDTYTVNVAVTLTDNAGSTLRNITGSGGIAEGSTVKLRYTRSGSATEYLETTLTWDSSSSSYTGSFSVSTTGVYSFTAVTIGSESVTSTTSAPSLSVHYDEGTVPEYAENLTTATQTVVGSTGSFAVRMANSSSSWKIKAVVKDTDVIGTDVTYTLDGEKGSVDSSGTAKWTFAAVDDSGEALEGNFQMTELQIYSASTGDLYTTIDVSEEGITAKIVTTVYISATYNAEDASEGETIEVTSGYAATSLASVTADTTTSSNFYAVSSYDTSVLEVVLADFEGEAVSGVTATSLEYTLDTDSTSDYGYTIVYEDEEEDAVAPTTMTLSEVETTDGATYTFADEDAGLNLWGEYTATLTYTVNGEEETAELASVEYTGVLPTFGNSSGTLPNTGLSTKQNNRSGVTNALVTASDEEGVYDFFSYASTSSSLETGQDADGDGDASDFIWNAYYLAAILPQYSVKENTTQKIMWDFDGWQKPAGYVQMYAQNIYL
ncbi:MAG: hypothetical protein LUB60_05625, partial [Clostridiales bacterium]|nr:hypothetical protein [Clostridiales bacterium]